MVEFLLHTEFRRFFFLEGAGGLCEVLVATPKVPAEHEHGCLLQNKAPLARLSSMTLQKGKQKWECGLDNVNPSKMENFQKYREEQ